MPCWRWLRHYDLAAARKDGIAGLLIATLLVPQAAAYTFLAGLPASVGFLAAAFAPIGYAIWATGRHVSVGPVAVLSVLTATAVGSAGGDPLETASQLALMVGVILVLIGLLRIGHLTNFISEPVLTGFIAGAALMVGMTQAGNFAGVDLDRDGSFLDSLWALAGLGSEINYHALTLAVATLVLLVGAPFAARRVCERFEFSNGTTTALANLSLLGVLALAIVVTAVMKLPVETVGQVKVSLPQSEWITLGGWAGIKRLLPDALAIAFIGYVMAYGTAASLAGRRRLTIDRNYEAGALGAANLASAFTGGYPVGASLSRSAIAESMTADSVLAPVLAGLITLGVGLASFGLFDQVAKAVLAALIMKAVLGMIDLRAIWRFLRYSKADAAGVTVTLCAVVALGIRWGVVVGALTSLMTYLLQTSLPRIVIEGLPNEDGPLRDTDRKDTDSVANNVMILRMDDHLYFGSAAYLEEQVTRAVAEHPHIEHLVISLKAAGIVDATGLETLKRLNENMERAGVRLHLAHAHKPVELQLRHSGLVKKLHGGKIFESARDALDELKGEGKQ